MNENHIPLLSPFKSALKEGYVTTADQIKGLDEHLNKSTQLTNITYQELKSLRDSSQLTPGRQYRMTDFVTTCTDGSVYHNHTGSASSAGHQFDLILTALTVNSLEQDVKAVLHDGDIYFANSDLSAWVLRYTIDNNKRVFAWADEENGKGVIYYLKDEFGNECSYDFKNILYNHSQYTFQDINGGDFSLNGAKCYLNVIKESNRGSSSHFLGGNMFLEDLQSPDDEATGENSMIVSHGCHHNFIDTNCFGNSFRGNSSHNTLGTNCRNNAFSFNCSHNTLGGYCIDNTLRDNCSHNNFGNNCSKNIFHTNSCFNTLHNRNMNNEIKGSYNVFGENNSNNNCYYVYNSIFEKNCAFNVYASPEDTIQNLYVLSNTLGTADQLNIINVGITSRLYKTIVSMDENGQIKIAALKPNDNNMFSFGGLLDNTALSKIDLTVNTKVYYVLSDDDIYPFLKQIAGLRVSGSFIDFNTLSEENTVAFTDESDLTSTNFYGITLKSQCYLVWNNGWFLCPTGNMLKSQIFPRMIPEGKDLVLYCESDNRFKSIYFFNSFYEYPSDITLLGSRDYLFEDTFETEFGDCHYGKKSLGLGHSDNVHYGLNIICHKGDSRSQKGEIRYLTSEFSRGGGDNGTRILLAQDRIQLQALGDTVSEELDVDPLLGISVGDVIVEGIADPWDDNHAANKRYVDSCKIKVKLINSDGSIYQRAGLFLEPNIRYRFAKPVRYGFTITTIGSTILNGYHVLFANDEVKKFEIEFFVSPDITDEELALFDFNASGRYNKTIYWEKPIDIKAGCYYRITIDYSIATYIEIAGHCLFDEYGDLN